MTAKGPLWDPAGVSPKGRSLSVRFSVLAVIYYLHRDAVDDLSMSEQAGVWILQEEVEVLEVVWSTSSSTLHTKASDPSRSLGILAFALARL